MQLFPIPPNKGNRLGILRKQRDKEILRVTKHHPKLKGLCEDIASRTAAEVDDDDWAVKDLEAICHAIHVEERNALRGL